MSPIPFISMTSFVLVVVVVVVTLSLAASLHVAIVGAGVGAAAASYFIRALSPDAQITVLERHAVVGGRLKSFVYDDGTHLELGGSIGVGANRYFRDLATTLNLTVTSALSVPGSYAVSNGTDLVFQSWTSALGSWPNMIYRYGLASFLIAPKISSLVADFDRIYGLQQTGVAFRSSAVLWDRLSLLPYTRRTLKDALLRATAYPPVYPFMSRAFVDELVSSVTHINYLQSPDVMHSLAGLIGLAPLYSATNEVFRIEEGNSQLVSRLLESSGANLLLNSSVAKIAKFRNAELGRSQWNVTVAGAGADHTFDRVVVAAPLEHAAIRFEGDGIVIPSGREYQRVHTTIVQGQVRPDYFGKSSRNEVPTAVGATTTAPFAAFSVLKDLGDGRYLVKLFSESPLADATLQSLFRGDFKILTTATWDAYPKFHAGQDMADFSLAEGLYYLNAIESGGSCIEISAISGRNVALLMKRDLDLGPGPDLHVDRAGDGPTDRVLDKIEL